MSIDLRQFHQTFFEESLEGLAVMERELLNVSGSAATVPPSPAGTESLNTMFRVVHSIKGGSGVFGFNDIARFSHAMESLLDDLRAARRVLDPEVVTLLLQCLDGLRTLVADAHSGNPADTEQAAHLQQRLERYLGGVPGRVQAPAPAETTEGRWKIVFRPGPELFRSGNDPLRIVREISEMGRLDVQAETSVLPCWEQFDPERCYLSWTLMLDGSVNREQITEVFSWVMDDSKVDISPQTAAIAVPGAAPISSSPATDAPMTSIRVATQKIDALINSVGELLITQSMLAQATRDFSTDSLPLLLSGLSQLERNARDLQEGVMRVRMVSLSFIFNRLPRLIHDVSGKLGKKVELRISGEQNELDKTVIERISDPVLHLVRNCLDHGIEGPAERREAGKPEAGVIAVEASQKGGSIVIEIRDDGRGLPYERIRATAIARGLIGEGDTPGESELAELIFAPGLSTAEDVSDLSGRGVGMDIVRRNIESLGGTIEVTSRPGQGTCFKARLPLTLAIIDGLSVRVGPQVYLIPLVNIVESVQLDAAQIRHPAGHGDLVALRGEYLPLIRLQGFLGVPAGENDRQLMVVVEADGRKAGLCVDDLLDQQQVVLKSLDTHYRRPDGVLAATVLGDGRVALVLDPSSLVRFANIPASNRATSFDRPSKAGSEKEIPCLPH
ncbi:MAG: chemotaxis protein CheA [Acidiferrobacteraceae bacterium]